MPAYSLTITTLFPCFLMLKSSKCNAPLLAHQAPKTQKEGLVLFIQSFAWIVNQNVLSLYAKITMNSFLLWHIIFLIASGLLWRDLQYSIQFMKGNLFFNPTSLTSVTLNKFLIFFQKCWSAFSHFHLFKRNLLRINSWKGSTRKQN